MVSLFDASSGMEQPASIDGTLGRLGSSYLDADCILVGCPSRDAFLLPDDLEEPPAAPQHTTLSTAAGLQQQHSQKPSGVGAGGHPSRTPTGGPFSLAAGIQHRTPPSAHVLPNSNSSSIAWDNKPGAGMPSGLHGSRQTDARSPLLSARTAAALMSGEDDVQQAGLDLLDGPFSLPMVEGELLQWGTGGAQGLGTEGPPTRGLTGFSPSSTARVGAQGAAWHGPAGGQQYHSQQQRLLHASFPAGYSSPPPAATSRQHGQHISPGAYHPRLQQQHQHQHLQPGAYVDHRSSPQQQLQPGVQAAAWQQQQQQQQQQMRMQMQQAFLQQQRQQQLGASLGSSRPVARVLHPPGLQNGHFPAHVLQQQLQAHQHRQQQQQQVQVQAQGRQHPALQQQWPAGSPPAAGRASAAGAAAGAQGHAGAAAVAAAFPGPSPSKPDRSAGAQAGLHTWGSNTSSMTAAVVDAATASPGAVTTAAGSSKADTPTDSTPVAAAAAPTGSDALVQQQEQGVAANPAAGLQESASPSASEGKAANTAAAAAGAKPGAASPAGELTANTAAAASPGKDRPATGGARVTALSSANSGSMGDSSHDSSQTQQQDAGSAEPLPSTTGGAAGAAGAAAGVGATAGPADAEGGQEGAGNQPRIFHHKGGGPCDHCGVMESPQWRRGPPAKPILCNACGTRYRRTHHLGPPIPSGGHAGGGRPSAAGGSSGRGSSGGSTPGRKRAAAAEALGPAPLPVNYEGGVHTGTRLARNPNRPAPKQYKLQDV